MGWPGLALVLLLVLLLTALVLGVWRSGARATVDRPRSADDLLSERFARGELTRQQYQEALVDLLKDRYVRGEVDLEGYEAHLALLLGEERQRLKEMPSPTALRESSREQ
ncbi:MAG: hypothetical protein HYU88_14430 [Chloroflexi bacterium]|nr:hypothetical protein [Chloroflexota bacterium]